MPQSPILWTFRRCPYAIRARMAVLSAGVRVELREILLKDKPSAFLEASTSATVPCLALPDQTLDESVDIMVWALKQNDPEGLLDMPHEGWALIKRNDGPFKTALDHTKYAVRFPDLDADEERGKTAAILLDLDRRLQGRAWLFGDRPTIADHAILPFVRQFANTDSPWFNAQDWPDLRSWLTRFTGGDDFARIMTKYTPWAVGNAPVWFGGGNHPRP